MLYYKQEKPTMAEKISPFPEPKLAKLEPWQAKEVEALLIYSDKTYAVNIGKQILRSGSVLLPAHFHRMATTMESGEQERSFKRGACLGLAFVALKSEVSLSEDALYGHLYALNEYRDERESLSSAAMRLGDGMLSHDDTMAACAEYAVFVHPDDRYQPDAIRAGVGYAEVLAERALSIDSLNAQYGDELAGIFDDIEE